MAAAPTDIQAGPMLPLLLPHTKWIQPIELSELSALSALPSSQHADTRMVTPSHPLLPTVLDKLPDSCRNTWICLTAASY
jgi:hypothetical protein